MGWAFTATRDEFCAGAVENRDQWAIAPAGKTGAEAYYTDDPVTLFRSARVPYDCYKVLPIAPAAANPADALTAVDDVIQDPYFLIARNCLDATRRVLTTFGVQGLPSPKLAGVSPNIWFLQAPGQLFDIRTPFYWAGHPLVRAQMARVNEAEKLAAAAVAGFAVSQALQSRMQLILQMCRSVQQAAATEDWPRAVAESRLLFSSFANL